MTVPPNYKGAASPERLYRHTQSVAFSPGEQSIIRLAAQGKGVSVSAWGYGRVLSALASNASQAGAKRDLGEVHARGVAAHLRTARSSILFPAADYAALKIVAGRMGTSAHALVQAILICDSERAIGATPPAKRGPVETEPRPEPETEPMGATVLPFRAIAAPPLPDDVVQMLAALDAECWPGRAATEPCSNADFARALSQRAKVRAGVVKLRSHARRDETGIELLAAALLAHPIVRDVSGMVCLPLVDVARGVALRCTLNRAKAAAPPKAPPAPVPDDPAPIKPSNVMAGPSIDLAAVLADAGIDPLENWEPPAWTRLNI